MKNKLIILVVVIVAVIAVYFWVSKGPKLGDFISSSPTPTASPAPAGKAPAAKKSTDTAAPLGDYTTLVKQYEGRRIQFDDRCQPVPLSPTYKSGTSIMLDNRSSQARVVKVGDTSYSLSGFGYRIITLTSTSLPKEYAVSCGSAGKVGQILLQALISQ